MNVQPARRRIKNFKEVSLGLPKKAVIEEARRCLQGADPLCLKGCPLGIDIPAFIRFLRDGHVSAALSKIKEANCFPSICGRICPAPCEGPGQFDQEDVRRVELPPRRWCKGIRVLERYAADFGNPRFAVKERKPSVARAGKRVAIVGSGAAGLTAAAQLAEKGYRVAVFESMDRPGGALRYGIPAFRLPRKILDDAVRGLKTSGVEFKTNCYVGRTILLEDLSRQGFEAILLATGGGIPKLSDIPGADLGGVYYAEEFLMRVNLARESALLRKELNFPLGAKVAVIGSGNVALDCARLAVRLGPAPGGASRKVTVLSPRSWDDKRAFQQECAYGQEEGVSWESPVKPLELIADVHHFVSGVRCVRLDYADVETQGRWELMPVPDSEFVFEADTVIMAVGHGPNVLMNRDCPGLRLNADGGLWAGEENSMTSLEGVFACGNVIKGGSVVEAMASGQKAAEDIDRYLKGR
ncbi:MAG: hypothetical protein A3D87_05955 [Omnitrophica WOR_2 bacterium RIFCSPHIGHO2_02_FULL_50_17]|nr:MAG: hypothetical protein A3D87_05955 [Omnitrophica WOR_2 bacterium RIFCSPHIGHO2_02_FULL_50_17]